AVDHEVHRRVVVEGRAPQLLAGADALLHSLALGDVGGDAGRAVRLALAIADERPTNEDPGRRAIGADDAVFLLVRIAASGEQGGEGVFDWRAIFGVDRGDPLAGIGVDLAGGPTPDPLVARADVEDPFGRDLDDPQQIGDVVGQAPEAVLALAEGELG